MAKRGGSKGSLPSKAALAQFINDSPGRVGKREIMRAFNLDAGDRPALLAWDAIAKALLRSVDAGATWVTHLFNAMAPLHHRDPGLAGLALSDGRLHVGLIPDGIHVHPAVVAMAQRALGERLTIVTDAVAALGQPAGSYGPITVGDDGVRLADGTLAGSNLAMDQGVRNLVAFTGCPPEAALHAASTAPAAVLADPTRGTLAPGARGDLVLLSEDLDLVATVLGGEVVHDRRGSR